MKLVKIAVFLLFTSLGTTFAQNQDLIPNRTEANKIDIEKLSFIENFPSEKQLFVVIFVGTDCPISQKYVHTLRTMYEKYESGVEFIGIIPHNFSEEKITNFKQEYRIPFKLIKDRENKFAKALHASVTPEVFFFNRSGNLFYDGAIDNWFFALGKNRRKASEHYLKDAIENVQLGAPVMVSHRDAVGCFIELKH